MDSSPPPPGEPTLKYKTCVLKVSIHCVGCKRKVKRVLQSIQGVYTVDIDSKQHKVTVLGDVEVDVLVKNLIKTGKNAEKWPEIPNQKEKPPTADDNKEREKGSESSENNNDEENNNNYNPTDQSNKPGGPSVKFAGVPENTPPLVGDQTGGGKKKKKKNKKNSAGTMALSEPTDTKTIAADVGATQVVEQVHLSPPRGHLYPMPVGPAYVTSYSEAHPSGNVGPAYYIPPAQYTYDYPEDVYDFVMLSRPSYTFEMLSDENPYGCFVM